MKKRILLTSAALAQSLVVAALTMNSGVASATAFGPNTPDALVPGNCVNFDMDPADPNAPGYSGGIFGQVSYNAAASAWCKHVDLTGYGETTIANGTVINLIEVLAWDDQTNLWSDWHEEILFSDNWVFGNGRSTIDFVFSQPFGSGAQNIIEKTLVCGTSTTSGDCGLDVYIYEWPTVEPHNPIPEPSTFLLLGVGLVGIAGRRYATRR